MKKVRWVILDKWNWVLIPFLPIALVILMVLVIMVHGC